MSKAGSANQESRCGTHSFACSSSHLVCMVGVGAQHAASLHVPQHNGLVGTTAGQQVALRPVPS